MTMDTESRIQNKGFCCLSDGCFKKARTIGLCNTHYVACLRVATRHDMKVRDFVNNKYRNTTRRKLPG